MSPLRLIIEDGKFRDPQGRHLILRGINVAGDAKYPSEPEVPSHEADHFFDGDNVSFRQRPFPREDAHLHFSRLKLYGYNTIRYVFTWEAIEAAGPGKYDEEWITHTIQVLRVAKDYGFYIFMDPHQDVWSRFSGGSGAPMWTLYAAGLDPRQFVVTEAALIHNTYPEPDKFPKMIWSTNYYRLAAATMFTMFYGGKDFAPKCIIDGVNIQDYLQDHFLRAIAHLAQRIHEAGDINNEVVFGWETLNEPNKGMIGHPDISTVPKEQVLKKGTCPTAWQTFLTGMGRAVEVDTWDVGGLGPFKAGRALIDPKGEIAWLPADYDDSRYGWKRDPDWKLGECIWAQHGVWKAGPEGDVLLKKDYFTKHPRSGKDIDYLEFTNTYLMDHIRKYKNVVRTYHPETALLLQPPAFELPPKIKGTEDDDPRLIYTPHFYDGITLMTKKWNRWWNVDVLGILRGRYLTPAFGVKVGETAIRNCFRDQLAGMRQEGIDFMGNHPCILSEFGIPYDMDNSHAYNTGDYSSQSAAMDANHFAVEGALMEGYTLWLYMTKNTHQRGDNWNGEDLSIFSLDDSPLPVSPIPRGADLSTTDLTRPTTTSSTTGKDVEGDIINPANLKRTLATPSISSEVPEGGNNRALDTTTGLRAAEAYVRPAPIAVAGTITHYTFSLRTCEFTLQLQAPASNDAQSTTDGTPTVIFLPEFHFPKDTCHVEVSSGKWEISEDEDETVLVQKLRWWHGAGEQSLKITGRVRRHNFVEGVNSEAGYYEAFNQALGLNCSVM